MINSSNFSTNKDDRTMTRNNSSSSAGRSRASGRTMAAAAKTIQVPTQSKENCEARKHKDSGGISSPELS